MKVTFDPAKRLVTLRERGIDFATDAEKVFAGPVVTYSDRRFDYSEDRQITIGWLNERMIVVVWTQRDAGRHIISTRYCHAKEETRFLRRFEGAWTVD